MRRRIIVPATFAVAVLGVAGTAVGLIAGDREPSRKSAGPAPTGTVDVRTDAQRAEDAFLGTTAAHLCNVAMTVYDDPAALARAYESVSGYPGLTAAEVDRFKQRLTTDEALSLKLGRQVATTCKPATAK
jgi:hypothetical protein